MKVVGGGRKVMVFSCFYGNQGLLGVGQEAGSA